MSPTTFRRPPTAQEAVLAELRRAIAAGDLAPGEQVLQDSLAERFGVSRVPLREALKVLEAEGQVTYQPHRGYFVTELDVHDLREVYALRDLLESDAVRRAVKRIGTAELSELANVLDQFETAAEAGDVASMADLNRQFHFGIIDAAGMPRMTRLLRVLWDATDVYRARYYSQSPNRVRVQNEHREILAALTASDGEAAVNLLRAHRLHAVTALEAEMNR